MSAQCPFWDDEPVADPEGYWRCGECPECHPEPATSPVVRCRKCGRSECRHSDSQHVQWDYDMHRRTECLTCVTAENRKAAAR